MYVFIPSPVRVGTLLLEVPGTPNGASFFFKFELKPTGKDSADSTQHEFQHHSKDCFHCQCRFHQPKVPPTLHQNAPQSPLCYYHPAGLQPLHHAALKNTKN